MSRIITTGLVALVLASGCERNDHQREPVKPPAATAPDDDTQPVKPTSQSADKRTKEKLINSLFPYYRERYGKFYEKMSRDDWAALVTREDTGYYIVQFEKGQYWSNKKHLERLGVENIRTGAGKEAAVFRFNPAKRKQVEALPFVRWVGIYHPLYKLLSEVYSGGKLTSDENVLINVYAFRNLDSVRSQIEKIGGEIVGKPYTGSGLTVKVVGTKIPNIAGISDVRSIELFHERTKQLREKHLSKDIVK